MTDADAPHASPARRGSRHPGLTVAHTAQLDPAALDAARLMVFDAFGEGHFDGVDWDHALGGMHVLVHEDGALVAHGSVVQRRFVHAGRAWRVGYVEAVAVAPAARHRGHGVAVMRALATVIARAYHFGALSATDAGAPLYRSLGWQPWVGSTAVLTPRGTVPTPEEDGAVHVLPVAADLDLTGELVCDWRDGDVW